MVNCLHLLLEPTCENFMDKYDREMINKQEKEQKNRTKSSTWARSCVLSYVICNFHRNISESNHLMRRI